MVKTGYIALITETGGGQDTDGNPIASVKVISDYVKCNLKTLSRDYKLLVDGQYMDASFSCYVDQPTINGLGIDLTTITEVSLRDNNGNNIKTYQKHNLEYLNLTKNVKIIV